MSKTIKIATFCLLFASSSLFAQSKIYPTSSFEFLFQNGQITKDGVNPDQNMRFTIWFNYTQQVHADFNQHLGLYSGFSIKNTGFITENEIIKTKNDFGDMVDKSPYETIKRRIYTMGIPLAIKLGALDKNFYFYGGGEVALAVAYKEKRFENGVKTKKSSFLGNETNLFQPSVFGGVQLPGGLNVQYRLFLDNMLDTSYGHGTEFDQSGFSKSVVQYISLSFNFGPNDWKKYGGYVSGSSGSKSM